MIKERQIGVRVGLPVFFAMELEDVYKHTSGAHRALAFPDFRASSSAWGWRRTGSGAGRRKPGTLRASRRGRRKKTGTRPFAGLARPRAASPIRSGSFLTIAISNLRRRKLKAMKIECREEDINAICDCVNKAMAIAELAGDDVDMKSLERYRTKYAFELIRDLLKPVKGFFERGIGEREHGKEA
jgi:hypothetical protein